MRICLAMVDLPNKTRGESKEWKGNGVELTGVGTAQQQDFDHPPTEPKNGKEKNILVKTLRHHF